MTATGTIFIINGLWSLLLCGENTFIAHVFWLHNLALFGWKEKELFLSSIFVWLFCETIKNKVWRCCEMILTIQFHHFRLESQKSNSVKTTILSTLKLRTLHLLRYSSIAHLFDIHLFVRFQALCVFTRRLLHLYMCTLPSPSSTFVQLVSGWSRTARPLIFSFFLYILSNLIIQTWSSSSFFFFIINWTLLCF